MNGKSARALRKVALDTACEMLTPDPENGTIPNLRYVTQDHTRLGVVVARSQRLGPCIRKIEKATKNEFNSLTR